MVNRLCNDRWQAHVRTLHHGRLREMKGTNQLTGTNAFIKMDHSEPMTMSMKHMKHKLKKVQLEEENYMRIEYENRLLLEKMSKIMGSGRSRADAFPFRSTLQIRPGYRLDATMTPVIDTRNDQMPKSLNREYRIRELKRITAENNALLNRIQNTDSIMSARMLEDKHKQDKVYLKNIRSREVMKSIRKVPTLSLRGVMELNGSKNFGLYAPGTFTRRSRPAAPSEEPSAAEAEEAPAPAEGEEGAEGAEAEAAAEGAEGEEGAEAEAAAEGAEAEGAAEGEEAEAAAEGEEAAPAE